MVWMPGEDVGSRGPHNDALLPTNVTRLTIRRMRLQAGDTVVALSALTLVCAACSRVPPAPAALAPVPATGRAVLMGSVRADRPKGPVQGALVRLRTPASVWHDSTVTDARGAFAFADLAPGEYVIDVLRIGFARQRRAATLVPNAVARLEVMLQASKIPVIADCISPDGRSMGSQFCR